MTTKKQNKRVHLDEANVGYIYRQRPAEKVQINPFVKEGHLVPKRINSNTSKTKEHSEKLEYNMRKDIVLANSVNGSSKSVFDIPFIKDKTILIHGSTTSTNVLDSIAKYAGIHNRNPQISEHPIKKLSEYGKPRPINKNEMLGLAAQETHNGAMPYGNFANSDTDKQKQLDIPFKEYNRALANANYFTAFGYIPAENLVRDFHYNKTHVSRFTPPLLDAFQYYAQGDYNPNDSTHTEMVNNVGKELWKNKDVQKWWEESGKYWYTTGKGPTKKYGGLITTRPSLKTGGKINKNNNRLEAEQLWRDRERNIAKSLISHPTLPNLFSAAEHYINSVPGLVSAPSEITGVIAGEPLLPSIKNVAYLSKVGSISKAIDEGAKEFASWEKAIANKDKIYNFANDLINIGNKRWNALINSEEYVNRINNNLRIDDIKDAYKAAKTIRRDYKSLPYDHNEWWSPYRGWTQEQYLAEINKQASLRASKRRNLENIKPNSEDIRKSIASVPIDDNIILQDRIQYLDDKGNLITKPDNYTGGYMDKTDKTHIKVDAPDIISTTIHEGGGHRVYRKTSYLNRNILDTPNIKLRFDYDEPFAKYYRNRDELRARTLPILANMHNKGYKLNYKGFLDYMKDNNIHISDSPLHPYTDNTIRHAINLIFGGTGIYVGNKIIEKDIKNDVNRRSLASGGSIYIKPSHRGRLTELKARTGKSESELYNDGNPAHKKMVVFARNARKWHH